MGTSGFVSARAALAIFFAAVLSAAWGGVARATYIADNYIGADDHGYGDVIAADTQADHDFFDIKHMDVTFSHGFMAVRIDTSFDQNNARAPGTRFGDLFY